MKNRLYFNYARILKTKLKLGIKIWSMPFKRFKTMSSNSKIKRIIMKN